MQKSRITQYYAIHYYRKKGASMDHNNYVMLNHAYTLQIMETNSQHFLLFSEIGYQYVSEMHMRCEIQHKSSHFYQHIAEV